MNIAHPYPPHIQTLDQEGRLPVREYAASLINGVPHLKSANCDHYGVDDDAGADNADDDDDHADVDDDDDDDDVDDDCDNDDDDDVDDDNSNDVEW